MRLRNPKRRNVHVQLLMSFAKPPPPAGSAPVWTALDEERRAEVLAVLARLIAKVATAATEARAADSEEKDDE